MKKNLLLLSLFLLSSNIVAMEKRGGPEHHVTHWQRVRKGFHHWRRLGASALLCLASGTCCGYGVCRKLPEGNSWAMQGVFGEHEPNPWWEIGVGGYSTLLSGMVCCKDCCDCLRGGPVTLEEVKSQKME